MSGTPKTGVPPEIVVARPRQMFRLPSVATKGLTRSHATQTPLKTPTKAPDAEPREHAGREHQRACIIAAAAEPGQHEAGRDARHRHHRADRQIKAAGQDDERFVRSPE